MKISKLIHTTYDEGLINILRSRYLKSPYQISIDTGNSIKSSSTDTNVIFVTPIVQEQKYSDKTIYIVLDPRILDDYYFFFNEDNMFEALSGTPNKEGNCSCRHTYNSNPSFIPASNKCMVSREKIGELSDPNTNHCGEGGAEIGVYTHTISLDKYLDKIVVPLKVWDRIKNDVDLEWYNKVETTGQAQDRQKEQERSIKLFFEYVTRSVSRNKDKIDMTLKKIDKKNVQFIYKCALYCVYNKTGQVDIAKRVIKLLKN
jgi:hypothetical protein